MTVRFLFALLALTVATDVEAGPLRRRAQQATYQPAYQQTYQPVGQAYPAVTSAAPAGEYVSSYTPSVPPGAPIASPAPADSFVGDGLDEVNAKRAARGLRPFVRDEGLTQAARACASFRAAHGLFGHTSNDFGFLPPGATASAAGCAAYPAQYGWMSCCTYDGYTYGGAAWVTGSDGKRYMHLFVR